MRKLPIGRFLLPAFVLLASVARVAAADPYRDAGSSAFAFLKTETSARAAALGSTGLLAAGSMGLFANPALVGGQSARISATHNEWLGSAREECVCWVGPTGPFFSSLGVRFLHVSDIEMRESATSEPLSTFSAYDMAFQAAAAARLGAFDVGLGAKLLREKIWREDSWGFCFDAGFRYEPWPFIQLAGAVLHVGPSFTLADEPHRMPMSWSLAGAATGDLPGLPGEAMLIARVSKSIDSRPDLGLGIEYLPAGWLALRGGYRPLHDSESFSAGLGLRAGGWTLDYAMAPYASSLGTTHRFSLARSI
ncbi:hypothetical protein JW921_05755 [Candidatus Fermentibacterales bacterium]|nr:hypothetical protein [Candidatus Fermentibacterales bacterium]